MFRSHAKDIKREQKKSLFFREIATILHRLTETERALQATYLTRVEFSADMGICYIYLAAHDGGEQALATFKQTLEVLKLYKASIRKNLATALKARYTPNLIFLYDEKREKQQRIESLLNQVHEELDDDGTDDDTTAGSS